MKKLLFILLLLVVVVGNAQQAYQTSIVKEYTKVGGKMELKTIEDSTAYILFTEEKLVFILSGGEFRTVYFNDRVESIGKLRKVSAIENIDGVNHNVIVTADNKEKAILLKYVGGAVLYSGLKGEF